MRDGNIHRVIVCALNANTTTGTGNNNKNIAAARSIELLALKELPEIVISTPSKLLEYFQLLGTTALSTVKTTLSILRGQFGLIKF